MVDFKKALKKKKHKKLRREDLPDHAPLSPSNASRWTTCTASATIDISSLPPETQSPHAARGTMLHDVAEKCLVSQNDSPLSELPASDIKAIQPYIDLVRRRGGDKYYELKVIFIPDKVFGTADTVILDYKNDTIEVIDLKTGAGVYVSAKQNRQLVCYGLGALREFGAFHNWKTIKMTISQAAADNPEDSWVQNIDEMMRWAAGIRAAVTDIENNNTFFEVSESNCRWCKAKKICPEVEKIRTSAARSDFAEMTQETEIDWGEKFREVEILKAYCKDVENWFKDSLLNNGPSFGYKAVEGRKTRFWLDPKKAEKKLMSKTIGLTSKDVRGEPKFLSPKQAEDLLIERGVKKEKIAKLIGNKKGAPTIVLESDSRPPIDREAQAKVDFAEDLLS